MPSTAKPLQGAKRPNLETIEIYSPNYHYDWTGVDAPAHTSLVLEKLGFQIVDTPDEADVIVLENNRFDASISARNQLSSSAGKPCRNWKNWEFFQDLMLKN